MRIPNIVPMLFLACSLTAQNLPCHIYDLTANVVDCANGQFYVVLDFQHDNTGDLFRVQGNGVVYDTFTYSQAPVTIGPLPADGTTNYEFIVRDLMYPDCQDGVHIGPVTCTTSGPCEIYDLTVVTGDCTSDSTYVVKLNFKVANATDDQFELVGNGHVLGTYNLSQLPLVIKDFPAVGNTGYVKVCIKDNPDCCRILQFNAPDCSPAVPCEIYDIAIQTGDCHSDGTYDLKLDFKVADATNDLFEVWAGNKYLGYFPLNQLPLTLNFPWGGGPVDVIKICINDNPNCCKVKEFLAPDCFNPCQIRNLRIDTDSCTSDSTYALKFAFDTPPGVDSFGVWTTSGQFLGQFAVADMPVSISDFPWGGGSVDGIKVCISNSCCREKEFNVPDCLAPPCGIADLTVKTGACTTPKTYKIELNFAAVGPVTTATKFSVWSDNGQLLGTYSLTDLPLGLEFPWNGDKQDALKVCLLDADGNELCCKVIRFDAPDCVGVQCGIFNLTVETGDCNADGSYQIVVNFQTPAVSLSKFGVWSGTGQFFGFFQVSDLPLKINNFKPSGGSLDKIIVCFGSGCCAIKEFNPPDCTGGNCGIVDLTAVPGDCNDDGTYQLKINFNLLTVPPGNTQFSVYAANGQFLGTYSTGDLPIVIQHFPWNGNAVDVVKICIGNTATNYCCRVKEFKAPDCTGAPCGIFDLTVKTGDCNPDGTYHIWVDFKTTAAVGAFSVTAGNGQFLGVYNFGNLPVHIPNFPASGNAVDVVKVCLISPTNTTPTCCLTKEFKAPDCAGGPCDIYDLKVETGDCASDSTYHVWINFKVNHPGTSTLFAVYANGNLYGQFPLSDLPLHIPDFPYNGGPNDVVKICIVSPLTVLCCETKEFPVPDCLHSGPCDIYDFVLDPGGCTSDSTYKLFLNFKVKNPGAGAQFGVWANGKLLGYYSLSDLPLSITNFPWGGGDIDVVKVCVVTSNAPSTTCCAVKEIHAPDCMMHQCEIYDLKVETGKCNDDGTAYEVWINFKVQNPPALSGFFGVWANGHFLGFFPLNQLPLYIPNFPTNGGPNDVVKICLSNTGTVGCCATKEFPVPDCVKGSCEIHDIVVQTGGCNNDGTYEIKLDFKVNYPGNDFFEAWAGNGKYLGYFPLKDLPVVISHFPWGGGKVDVIKICINDNPNCCRNFEFKVPDCILMPPPCHINDLTVKTGDCNDDGTYHAWVDFNVVSPSNNTVFGVWANGNFLGTYSLSQLPLHIEHFPTDGGPNDVVKVCILAPGSTQTLCCETKEFPVPACLGGPCEIYDLKVETGDCNDDGTYHAWVNFKIANPGLATLFGVWTNGNFMGTYSLNDLPLHIEHFPTDGGPNDVIKVCLVGTSPNVPPLCCRTIEFPVPDCLGGNDCKIYDLQVQHTPCLCGQFFAVLTFKHTGGGSGGFDIAGNGILYGNYPYNTQQPIILGPLAGDAVTNYEFVVRDHLHPDCQDAVDLGIIDCSNPVQISAGAGSLQQGAGKLVLSPNPTSNWLSVTALLNTGAVVGQATVEIRQADGRLIRTLVVPSGNSFQLDVAELQSGIYRLSLQTAAARLEGTFVKQ